MSFNKFFFAIILFLSSYSFGVEKYEVVFEGIYNEHLLSLLKSASQLETLQNSPPSTLLGLQRRAENDIKNFVKVLHSQAYYNARVNVDFEFESLPAKVFILIETGEVYPLRTLEIVPDFKAQKSYFCSGLTSESLGISLNEPATTLAILNAEYTLEKALSSKGYPYGRVSKRKVIADQEDKSITATLFVDSGPLCHFGDVLVYGNTGVRNQYFKKHLLWKKGDIFSPYKIKATQKELELSGLFSSVSVTIPETAPSNGELPIKIDVREGKPRTIGLGLSYETERGIGASFNWAHRNFNGLGDRVGVKSSFWSDKQFGEISYIQPDFGMRCQDLVWSADYLRELDEGYHSKAFSLSGILKKEQNKYLRYSYGLMYKYLIDTDIHEKKNHQSQKTDDETFNLLKFPISFYWNHSNSILNPTEGYRLKMSAIPSYKFIGSQVFYSINLLNASYYFSLDKMERHLIAIQGTFGSIPGPKKTEIPRSELFDAGTDTLLRGYRYKTVSPLDNEYKPTGGRSMMIYSFEYRYRFNKEFGSVLFYDFGNVYASRIPQFNKKILQSAGVGLRYFTPVGPIRFDLAFPLNPRKHVDKSSYQFYLSIGQTF